MFLILLHEVFWDIEFTIAISFCQDSCSVQERNKSTWVAFCSGFGIGACLAWVTLYLWVESHKIPCLYIVPSVVGPYAVYLPLSTFQFSFGCLFCCFQDLRLYLAGKNSKYESMPSCLDKKFCIFFFFFLTLLPRLFVSVCLWNMFQDNSELNCMRSLL